MSHMRTSPGAVFWICSALLMMSDGCTSPKEKTATDHQSSDIAASNGQLSARASQERLVGRWLRQDGGYILDIRSAASDGKLDVGYFNPNPIHVGRSAWVEKDGKFYVMVELQDVNYPGSTYGLEYKVGQDQLAGTYFQAVEKNTYEVQFVREK